MTTKFISGMGPKSALIAPRPLPIFFVEKCEKLLHCKSFSHFSTKNISVFGYEVVKQLTS